MTSRDEMFARFPIGTRVRALYPNTAWGEGTVIRHDPDRKNKPIVVQRKGGYGGGYFHPDQIEVITD